MIAFYCVPHIAMISYNIITGDTLTKVFMRIQGGELVITFTLLQGSDAKVTFIWCLHRNVSLQCVDTIYFHYMAHCNLM